MFYEVALLNNIASRVQNTEFSYGFNEFCCIANNQIFPLELTNTHLIIHYR